MSRLRVNEPFQRYVRNRYQLLKNESNQEINRIWGSTNLIKYLILTNIFGHFKITMRSSTLGVCYAFWYTFSVKVCKKIDAV